MRLRDGDLLLRAPRRDDAEAITAACQDPEVSRWTLVPSPYSPAHAHAFIERAAAEEAAGKAVTRLAVDAGDDRLLGSFGLMELDREPGYGEIGYWVAAEARGRGVATRAVRLLADSGRDELGLTRIDVLPHKDNVASQRVAEKAGFADTRELVGSERGGIEEPVFMVYRWTSS